MVADKKVFEILINYRETVWGTVSAFVEATSEADAKRLFMDEPWDYDWDGWSPCDSEIDDWEIDSIELDEVATKHLAEKKQLRRITDSMSHEDMDD